MSPGAKMSLIFLFTLMIITIAVFVEKGTGVQDTVQEKDSVNIGLDLEKSITEAVRANGYEIVFIGIKRIEGKISNINVEIRPRSILEKAGIILEK